MIVFLVVLAVILVCAEAYSLRHSLDMVTYRFEPSQHLIDPGEPFTLVSTVENQKWLPLTFVRMVENFPPEMKLAVDPDKIYSGPNEQTLTTRFYLLPHQAFSQRVEARLQQRGCYFFRTATLYGGDFLGVKEDKRDYRFFQELVVIPPSVDCPPLKQALGNYLGQLSVNRFILEDPMLTVGFREYSGREPMRAISWVQSARMGKMMVKNYDHTLDYSITILLNVDTPQLTDESVAKIERCFSLVRAVCEELERKKINYSFATNATISGFAGSWSQIDEGLGGNHFRTVLEGLGRATCQAIEPFGRTLDRAFRQAESGRSFLLVTPQRENSWLPQLQRLEELSAAPVLVLCPDELDALDNAQPQKEVASA